MILFINCLQKTKKYFLFKRDLEKNKSFTILEINTVIILGIIEKNSGYLKIAIYINNSLKHLNFIEIELKNSKKVFSTKKKQYKHLV